MDKAQLLPQSPSPPPYEAPAYPRRRPRPLFLRSLLSVRVLLSFILTAAVLWLCAIASREAYSRSQTLDVSSSRLVQHFDDSLAHCVAINTFPQRPEPQRRKTNPRWTSTNGQEHVTVLRNATLFDGESFHPHPVDITFSEGLIVSVTETSNKPADSDAIVHDLHGRYVTPGLVDMHSHHLSSSWPGTEATDDTNEMNDETKAFTPFVRIIDALKASDIATSIICSGGVTSSLIIPGSANLIAGVGLPVKNVLYSGEHGEPVVEDVLLERGIPLEERHLYMKMAYGENPKGVWGYTRLGNAWHLREHLQKAKELKEKQDDYCAAVSQAHGWDEDTKAVFVREQGKFPFQLELDATIGVLRGRIIVQNHNYEPEDMETMLRISHEFGYRVWGFHHATEAWQIPELLKEQGDNVTIATFAEFSLYKQEAYSPSLYAGHILDAAGVPVAYKSDHVEEFTNAKYLASQAAIGHAFLLPEEKALQSITSIPAKAVDLDYRVGYCRPGYDADITVWNIHPLRLGATPLQVFIDGQPQLDQGKVETSMGTTFTTAETGNLASAVQPQMRYEPELEEKEEMCARASEDGQSFVITGIQKAFVEHYSEFAASVEEAGEEPLDLIISNGNVVCLGSTANCAETSSELKASGNAVEISLQNGHVLPGLTAMTGSLGMREIVTLDSTGDGEAGGQKINDPESLTYAKYGVWLDGKEFARARLGGVTRAISAPLALDKPGMVQGVSVEILTSGQKTLVDGGIVQGDVALHITLGDDTKASEGTISNGVQHLRKMLQDGKTKNNATTYGQVAAGELPLVVQCNNKYDMSQLILVKKDFPETNIVILGGKEAPYVAKELADADIPILLSEDRPAPDHFRDKDAVVGPPLTPSVASYLVDAGVKFAIAIYYHNMPVDFKIHDLGPEAAWTAMYAGLNEKETVRLVTTNVESILGLKTKNKDLVVFEGSPLQYGASVVLSFHADDASGKLEVATCFPRENDVSTKVPTN